MSILEASGNWEASGRLLEGSGRGSRTIWGVLVVSAHKLRTIIFRLRFSQKVFTLSCVFLRVPSILFAFLQAIRGGAPLPGRGRPPRPSSKTSRISTAKDSLGKYVPAIITK